MTDRKRPKSAGQLSKKFCLEKMGKGERIQLYKKKRKPKYRLCTFKLEKHQFYPRITYEKIIMKTCVRFHETQIVKFDYRW